MVVKRPSKDQIAILTSVLVVTVVILSVGSYLWRNLGDDYKPPSTNNKKVELNGEVSKFRSEEEFFDLIQQGSEGYYIDSFDIPSPKFNLGFNESLSLDSNIAREFVPSQPSRYSETNVQVLTIDESDMVKTDGRNIFFSVGQEEVYYPTDTIDIEEAFQDELGNYQNRKGLTNIISAFPLDSMDLTSVIEEGGELYLYEDILIIERVNEYSAYDITDPENPEIKWSFEIEQSHSLLTSRMYNGYLYMITQKSVYENTPCPIPMLEGDLWKEISCTEIYHSGQPNNSVHTVVKIEPLSGILVDELSFLGSYDTIVYMSEDNLYLTYSDNVDQFIIMYDFIKENDELFSSTYIKKVENLSKYEISNRSKIDELRVLTNNYLQSLSSSEKLEKQTRLINRFDDYTEKNIRVFSGTGLVKVGLDSLQIDNVGKVQGRIPDQFAMDEYNGKLRVATNVEPYQNNFFFGNYNGGFEVLNLVDDIRFNDDEVQQNDVVVLNEDMEVIGEVRGLGITEDIYSTRFIGEAAYVVTFRQIDPFYVVDLSDPTDPIVKGELKIPGYSSYLHPISNNLILGIGEEDWRVKISLFDVSDPSNPQELSKYSLSSNWSEVESNHNAFLHDAKHSVFFLPTNNGGHIISYEGSRLDLVRSIDGYDVKRAVYINDYMYILSTDKVVVFDENSWEKVKELQLEQLY